MTARRPLPLTTPEEAPFWTGGKNGQLLITRCANGHYIHPPKPICPNCLSRGVTPTAVSGKAVVATFTVNMQPWLPDMPIPCVIAVVELPEQKGLRLTTNIVNLAPDQVRIGLPVRVVFEAQDDVWFPLFEPDTNASR
jgi:uncharacterized protein